MIQFSLIQTEISLSTRRSALAATLIGYQYMNNRKINSLKIFVQSFRGEMKKSPFKIWLRVFLLVQFSIIFGIFFSQDIAAGYFTGGKVTGIILFFIPIGYLISYIVPMHANVDIQAVTLSLDRVYLFLIWILVIAKLLASYLYHTESVADVIMCIILGIMGGRLGGIIIRVEKLKIEHGFMKN